MRIKPKELIPMDIFTEEFSLRIDLAYARNDNLLFEQAIYRDDARLWLHESLANIIILAAKYCADDHNLRMVLYDGLRTSDAQAAMLKTTRVQDNPHWLEEPRLLSPPGAGAHPRGMAIDLSLESMDGALLDMGTEFDYLAENSSPKTNPAHRAHPHLSPDVIANRKILDDVMERAADKLSTPLLPLPQEWWDFRLPPALYDPYEPLNDQDLPSQMQMCKKSASNSAFNDFDETHFKAKKHDLIDRIT